MTTTPCRVCGRDSTPLRWACPACVRDTRRRLDEITEHTTVIVTAGLIPGRGALDGLPRTRSFESKPPLSLDHLVALDRRSRVGGDGPDDDPNDNTLSIVDTLHRVAAYVRLQREEAGVADVVDSRPRSVTITGEARYLRINAEWCAHQTWGVNFVEVVKALHGQTCRQAHDTPPVPLGPCIEDGCTGTVWRNQADGDRGQCTADRAHTYVGLHLARLADRRTA